MCYSLSHLVGTTNQDIYVKLIISALDYTKEGYARSILAKALSGTEEVVLLNNIVHSTINITSLDWL